MVNINNCKGCQKIGCYLVINDAPAMSSVRENCPCFICLVKMVCVVKCDERIQYYKKLHRRSHYRWSDYQREMRENDTM